MYSPKIDESLIPRIYRAAKAANIPMTVWVSQVVESALPKEGNTAQPLIVLEGGEARERPAKARIPA
jgi:hypothetical protein